MTVLSLLFSVLLATGSLSFGYASAGLPQAARWILLFGLAWLVAIWRRWQWFAYVGLTLTLVISALGLWLLNFSPGWMFAGAIGGLLAFDLTDFRQRLRYAASDEERRTVERRHLPRLALLAIVSMALATVAMLVKVQLSFEWTIVLVVIAVFGLIQLVGWFRTRR